MEHFFNELGLKPKKKLREIDEGGEKYVTVKLKGDYNDADYAIEETVYDMTSKEDIQNFRELIRLLRLYINPDGMCGEDCEVCQQCGKLKFDELIDAMQEVVDFPRGPWSICHTIISINMFYTVDDVTVKLVDVDKSNVDWDMPMKTDW